MKPMLLNPCEASARTAGLFLIMLMIVACSGHVNEQSVDSEETIYEEPDYNILRDPRLFTIRKELELRSLTVLGQKRTFREIFEKLYYPDTFTSDSLEGANPPEYIITDVQLVQGKFFVNENLCEDRSVLMCTRGDYVEEEFYDLFFLASDNKGDMKVSDKVFFEGSQGQSATEVRVSLLALPVQKGCSLLMVSSQSEGGDINLHREEWVEIFIAGGKGFRSLFKLQLEQTDIQDYESTEDDQQDSSSKIQDYAILTTAHNGLFDIKVSYTQTQNGKVVLQGEEEYHFDGEYYVAAN